MLQLPHYVMAALVVILGASVAPARAEPLRLDDSTPRSLIVRFENSPRNEPALLDRSYGPPLPARIESAGVDLVRVVIEGSVVAQHLFGDDSPEPGAFSDFVWLFDVQSGHVLDARFEGRIEQQLDWGFLSTSTSARVRARMSTREHAGFLPVRRVLGNRVFRHCDPSKLVGVACRSVEATRYDRERGYVNAVGVIEVVTPLGIKAQTFSPLGEAIFLELGTASAGAAPLALEVPEAALPSSIR
jgi:hypothetical protein